MEKCLLLIYAAPALEEALEDWLLEHDYVSGFSTAEVYGHGQRPSGMTLLEQVTGHQRRMQFMIEAKHDVAVQLVAGLREKFKGTGLHYAMLPMLEAGSL